MSLAAAGVGGVCMSRPAYWNPLLAMPESSCWHLVLGMPGPAYRRSGRFVSPTDHFIYISLVFLFFSFQVCRGQGDVLAPGVRSFSFITFCQVSRNFNFLNCYFMHSLYFLCFRLGIRHRCEDDPTARRSLSRLEVRGYRTVQYSLISTTSPIPTPFSLHFSFTFLLPSR